MTWSPSTWKSSFSRMDTISSAAMSVPSRALIFSGSSLSTRGWGT